MNTCNCHDEIDKKLEAEGLRISDKCQTFRIQKNKLSAHIGFPLQTKDGKKVKRGQPAFMFLTYCPFCGEKYEKDKPVAATPQATGE